MDKWIKIGTYITPENDKMWKKACYLLDKKKKDVLDEALKIGLKQILKRLEENEIQ